MKDKKIRILLKVTFVFYIVFLLKMIVFKYVGPLELFSNIKTSARSINLVAFRGAFGSRVLVKDTIGNIIAFLPLGVYYKLFDRERSFIKGILIFLLISIGFESTQYIFAIGAGDITDVIMNTSGGILGMLSLKLLDKIIKDRERVDKFIAISATIIMTLLSILIILLKLYN